MWRGPAAARPRTGDLARDFNGRSREVALAGAVLLGAPTARPLQLTTFGHARFAREHGATLCSDIATDGGRGLGQFPICQFDHPGVLGVSTRRGVYWFWAGFMSPATVSVEHGVPTCVIGANQDFGHRLIFDAAASAKSAH